MGLQQSKDKLVYQQVKDGNIDGIRSLRADGAGLEWMDKEGKTPLIVACMDPELYNVAKTLIELGANVNAYHPGHHGGTPLYHAVERSLDSTVQLLLSHGANALMMDGSPYTYTPLGLARAVGYNKVARTIEDHICLFSGWLKELHGLAPNYLSRKDPNPAPRTVVVIWKVSMKEPNINRPEPAVVIYDRSTSTCLRFAALTENDEQLLRLFYNACKGIPQAIPPAPVGQASAPPISEDDELAMAVEASLQSSIIQGPGPGHDPSSCTIHSSSSNPAASSTGTANNSNQDVPDIGIARVPTEVQHKPCVVCLVAPVEGACIPCAHMAGCMSCLNKIKAKNGACPICRADINKVMRIFIV